MSRRETCADALQHYLYFPAEGMHLWFIDQLQHNIGIVPLSVNIRPTFTVAAAQDRIHHLRVRIGRLCVGVLSDRSGADPVIYTGSGLVETSTGSRNVIHPKPGRHAFHCDNQEHTTDGLLRG